MRNTNVIRILNTVGEAQYIVHTSAVACSWLFSGDRPSIALPAGGLLTAAADFHCNK